MNHNDLTEGSVIFFSQDYTNHRRDWDEFSEVYESILLKLKDKYSNKNIFYRLHPYIERQEYKQELNFHLLLVVI